MTEQKLLRRVELGGVAAISTLNSSEITESTMDPRGLVVVGNFTGRVNVFD